MIIGIILAAGEAKRMGEPKQLLDWQGEPLIRWIVKCVSKANFDLLKVVIGAYQKQIESVLIDLNVELVVNSDYPSGQSSSVRKGLENCPSEVQGAAFILGDQPLIRVETFNNLISIFHKETPGILIPTFQQKSGNPVFFHRRFFPALSGVAGDIGGRELIKNNHNQIRLVEVDDPGVVLDIDNQGDYLKLKSASQ